MNWRFISIVILLLSAGVSSAFKIQLVRASGTIYIRSDGSIDPSTAPILSGDNVTYTFTDNIRSDADGIVVERSSVIIDGNGNLLQGSGSGYGFYLASICNVTIRNTNIKDFEDGVRLEDSSGNSITGNSIADNGAQGIYLYSSSCNRLSNNTLMSNYWYGFSVQGAMITRQSSNNTFTNNTVADSVCGFQFWGMGQYYNTVECNLIRSNGAGIQLGDNARYNSFRGNTISDNEYGLMIFKGSDVSKSYGNKIIHNSFIGNVHQAVDNATGNFWDDGYPSGGNYWSDYPGADHHSGPYQNLTEGIGSDGIGDTNYMIDEDNADRYPLMIPWNPNPLIHPQEGQHANYTVLVMDSASEAILDQSRWNITYHKYVSPFIIYLVFWDELSPTMFYWTALNMTNRFAYDCVWPVSGIVANLWFPYLIETNVAVGSRIGLLNGTAEIVDSEIVHLRSRSLDCWKVTHDEEVLPDTCLSHTFWFDKSTGLMVGEESTYGSVKVNVTLSDSNILPAEPRIWTVDDDGPADFHTIQEAVNAAGDGDTVSVRSGIYREDIVVNKTVRLFGEDKNTTAIAGSILIDRNCVQFGRFSVEGDMPGSGVTLSNSSSSIVSDNRIASKQWAGIILMENSNNNTIINNIVVGNSYGLSIGYFGGSAGCNNNVIANNTLSNNTVGIEICIASTYNKIVGNVVENNSDGGILILHAEASDNEIYHNRILRNGEAWHRNAEDLSLNLWDDGYPCGGNYWSDYSGVDLMKGPRQDQPGSDGIGDVPYVVSERNRDNYPLMMPNQPLHEGDVNRDGVVDIKDIAVVSSAFGSSSGHERWSPLGDLNNDGRIDILDLARTSAHFGWHG